MGIVHLFLTLKSLVVTIGYSTPVFNIEEFGGHNCVCIPVFNKSNVMIIIVSAHLFLTFKCGGHNCVCTPVFNIEEFGGHTWGIVHLFLTLKSLGVTIGV